MCGTAPRRRINIGATRAKCLARRMLLWQTAGDSCGLWRLCTGPKARAHLLPAMAPSGTVCMQDVIRELQHYAVKRMKPRAEWTEGRGLS
jgi:hypothetical protein